LVGETFKKLGLLGYAEFLLDISLLCGTLYIESEATTMKYYVEIPEVHKALVEIEADTRDKEELLRMAEQKFEEEGC